MKVFEFKEKIEVARSYDEYLDHVRSLFDNGMTTGPDQSEHMVHFTGMNLSRMKRWNKQLEFHEDLRSYLEDKNPQILFLCISEGWCGDAAHSLPLINKMANYSNRIDMKVVLRDEHPDLMDAYILNGARSIPVIIALLEDEGEYLQAFRWGPGPDGVMKIKSDFKKGLYENHESFEKAVQQYYNQDKSQSIQRELLNLMKENI